MHLSYSKIKTYLSCPLKFKFTYIDRIPQKPKPYFRFSHIIHSSLNRYHFYQGKNLEDLLTFYNEAFRSSREKSERLYQEGKEILINFYHDFRDSIPYRVEEKFKVKIGSHILSGKIDRVDKVNGGYELIDYKVAKNIPSQEEIRENLQLRIYSTGFYKLTKTVPLRAGFYYLRQREKFYTVPTEEDIHNTIKLIYSVAGKIRGGNFLPNEGKICRMCDYRDRCFSEKRRDFSKETERQNQLIFNF